MKRTKTILLSAVVCLTLLAGCSTDSYRTQEYDPAHDAKHRAQEEAANRYFVENFPTSEQTLRVRGCITDRTGFDQFPEMPSDYGPHILTLAPGETLLEMPPEVDRAELECIFDLGLEDRYIPPWDQDALRSSNDS